MLVRRIGDDPVKYRVHRERVSPPRMAVSCSSVNRILLPLTESVIVWLERSPRAHGILLHREPSRWAAPEYALNFLLMQSS